MHRTAKLGVIGHPLPDQRSEGIRLDRLGKVDDGQRLLDQRNGGSVFRQ